MLRINKIIFGILKKKSATDNAKKKIKVFLSFVLFTFEKMNLLLMLPKIYIKQNPMLSHVYVSNDKCFC
ncbi:MAG: hypothetical protein ACJA0H_001926, partial [Francisellaceae bacterium]